MEVVSPQEIADRLATQPGVHGLIVTNKEGGFVHTSMDNTSTVTHVSNFSVLEQMASSVVRDVDPSDTLQVLRIRSHGFEVLIKPDPHYVIYVIQRIPRPNSKNPWGKSRPSHHGHHHNN